MAGTHPFLIRLRAVLGSLDDEALASLANKGLLRRARKDLEASLPAVVGAEEGRVRLEVGDATVEVGELPAKSTCSCPATGVCRHILAALVYLRDSSDLAAVDAAEQECLPKATSPDVATEKGEPPLAAAEALGSLGDDELARWAGKAMLRRAMKSLAAGAAVDIEVSPSLVVRFPNHNITCRWIPGGGLEGMVCSCQSQTVCRHVVAAVLAYQASLGRREIAISEVALQESRETPRSRAEVLAAVGAVLSEMVSLGMGRLSTAMAQRLTTLAVSAHGVDLPRLERMLKSLADEVRLALRRDAQSSPANLLTQAARIEALRTGLARNPTPQLVGRHRTQYEEVGQVTLIGLGAQRWRSKGGYHGLTVFFWDESRDGWATWSDSRPTTQPDFDATGRFGGEGPWAGCNSPRQAASSVLRLSHCWRNSQGRVSGRAATQALVMGPSRPREMPMAITSWQALAERAAQLFGGGLGERTENLEIVLLVPTAWGPTSYDPVRQEFLQPLLDDQGRSVNLWLPFAPENEKAVECLDRHEPAATFGLLGSLRLVAGRLCVQPISLYVGEEIVHLTLLEPDALPAGVPAKNAAARSTAPGEEELSADDEAEALLLQAASATPLGGLLTTLEAELESLVEAGLAVRRDLELIESGTKRLEALGLTACSHPLAHLVEEINVSARSADPGLRDRDARQLLRAYYVLRLASDQETIESACRGLT